MGPLGPLPQSAPAWSASGLSQEHDARQVSTPLYCLGEEAEDVLMSANAIEEDRKKLDTVHVMQKLDGFLQVRKNVILERVRFNRQNQHEGESTEEYITCLYNPIDNCQYMQVRDD